MTQAVVSRRDGDVFQARMFWYWAAKLLDAHSGIQRVGFESGPKGFDDFWVEYESGRAPSDHRGEPVQVDRFQCKWHATPGSFTHVDLTSPAYINAESVSLLQKADAAHQRDHADRIRSRLNLLTNHALHPDDVLQPVLRSRAFYLDIDKLFDETTDRSKMGRVRKLWREHLGSDEQHLKGLCMRLGFRTARDSLDELLRQLDLVCAVAGLKRPEPNQSSTVYDGLIFEWAGQKQLHFDRQSFKQKCQQEGLIGVHVQVPDTYGVKSFEHPFDRLEERCAQVLDLVPAFDERYIRDNKTWRTTLQPALKKFLSDVVRQSQSRIRLALDAHSTLAFAAGAVLDTKSGRIVEIEQRTPAPKVWAPDDGGAHTAVWEFEEFILDPDGQGTACGVSITRDVSPAMRGYVATKLQGLRRLLVARPMGGSSQQAVQSGAHAYALAEALAIRLQQDIDSGALGTGGRTHLFIAAPNAFTFYLGRHVHGLKPVTLYEFDFERHRSGTYEPSLSFPEAGIG
ncbi:SAVED domain-containing protein [Burkholderia cepacia]|uniref:SAVED domain-containing protein n=1 Tax=Burkholderia cepacia TaxID=292 RepID=UPI001CF29DED|nr:SAVED domain-containing protein [Burkholderia cepacia]MCA8318606.1 SAVED domain-containing protein [Burkholderia cepacia]